MGFRFEYVLWVPEEELWPLLDSVAAISEAHSELVKVTLPDGAVRDWPFRVVCDEEGNYRLGDLVTSIDIAKFSFLDLAASICFPLDKTLRVYKEGQETPQERRRRAKQYCPPDEQLAVGYIYILVTPNKKDRIASDVALNGVQVCFAAATSNISVLFGDSESIRQTFLELTRKHQCLCCYLDEEDCGVVFYLDGQQMEVHIPDNPDTLDEIRALVNANASDTESGR